MLNSVVDLGNDPRLGEIRVGTVTLHPKQVPALLSTADITLVLAGIRGGKTHVGALKDLLYAMTHPCGDDDYHIIGSPTYKMSKVPVEKMFKLLYDKAIFPICPLLNYRRSERIFELAAAGGMTTRIMVGSLHDPDRWRGIRALSAWLDEAAYISEYAWEVIQGRLADSAGPCWITTTPSGYNWVYDLYAKGLNEYKKGVPLEKRKIRICHWNSLDNVFNKREGILRLAERYDAKTHAQEVEAKFIKLRGLVYHAFSKRNVVEGAIDPSKPLWVGQDFNVAAMATVIGQPFTTKDGKDGFHIKYERKLEGDTYALARFMDNFIREHKIPKERVIIYADASGKARSTSGKSDFMILRDSGYKVDSPPRNPLVKDRVNCVNGLFAPKFSKNPRLLIDPRCASAIESMEKQIWDPKSDPPEPDKSMGFDHMADAIGYPCWKRWPLKETVRVGYSRKAA